MALRAVMSPRAAGRDRLSSTPEIWFQGSAIDGKQVWERAFPARRRDAEFHVTVIWDPRVEEARVLYLAVAAGDRAPRVPRWVRRDTRLFVQRLRAGLS